MPTATSPTATVDIAVAAVNDDPAFGNNAFTITDAGTLAVTGGNLSASDVDDAAGSLVFTVSGVSHGYFVLTSSPAVAGYRLHAGRHRRGPRPVRARRLRRRAGVQPLRRRHERRRHRPDRRQHHVQRRRRPIITPPGGGGGGGGGGTPITTPAAGAAASGRDKSDGRAGREHVPARSERAADRRRRERGRRPGGRDPGRDRRAGRQAHRRRDGAAADPHGARRGRGEPAPLGDRSRADPRRDAGDPDAPRRSSSTRRSATGSRWS